MFCGQDLPIILSLVDSLDCLPASAANLQLDTDAAMMRLTVAKTPFKASLSAIFQCESAAGVLDAVHSMPNWTTDSDCQEIIFS